MSAEVAEREWWVLGCEGNSVIGGPDGRREGIRG